MKKILIIEDDESHFNVISKILTARGFLIYPADITQLNDFKKSLNPFIKIKNEKERIILEEKLSEINPDLILLDIRLNPNLDGDKSGITIFNNIISEKFCRIPVAIFSSFSSRTISSLLANSENDVMVFSKEDDLDEGFVEDFVNTVIKWINEKLGIEEKDDKNGKTPNIFLKPVEYDTSKARATTNATILYSFYVSLIISSVLGVVLLVYNIILLISNPENIIRISENVFIIFLPLLIIAGFFVFYKNVLSVSISNHKGELSDQVVDSSTTLMKLTKKLFISSLISYLFIRVTELIYPSDTKQYTDIINNSKDSIVNAINKMSPAKINDSTLGVIDKKIILVLNNSLNSGNAPDYTQITVLGICILFLFVYYIYLDSHKNPAEAHKE